MVSLLDIIGPVMVGPSSSHTAGACRLDVHAANGVFYPTNRRFSHVHVILIGGHARLQQGLHRVPPGGI